MLGVSEQAQRVMCILVGASSVLTGITRAIGGWRVQAIRKPMAADQKTLGDLMTGPFFSACMPPSPGVEGMHGTEGQPFRRELAVTVQAGVGGVLCQGVMLARSVPQCPRQH